LLISSAAALVRRTPAWPPALRPEVVPRAWVAEARPPGEVAVVAPRRASAAVGARAALRRAVVERVAPSAAAARVRAARHSRAAREQEVPRGRVPAVPVAPLPAEEEPGARRALPAARLVPKVQRALAVARWAPPKPTDVARPVASLAAHGQLLGRSCPEQCPPAQSARARVGCAAALIPAPEARPLELRRL
jgi:hypothetical protein